MAVLPGYTDADVQARVNGYLTSGRVPTSASNPVVNVATVAVPVGGGRPPINAQQVTVTYTHSYMFLGGIGRLFGRTYATVPLRAASAMRSEVQ